MNNEIFKFDLVDKLTPEMVIENSLKQIKEATKGYVIGEIKEYGGAIYSYVKKTGIAASLAELQVGSETTRINIQDDLGEQDDDKNNRFEVFITAKELHHYKYRLMFVDYGTVSYPVTIVMNEALAVEYSGKRSYTFQIGSMKELENMMDVILNCETFVRLVQSLIYESMRREGEGVEENPTSGRNEKNTESE